MDIDWLSERDLSVRMRSVICNLAHQSRLYCTGGRLWLDTGFEATVPRATFYGLIRRKLLRLVRRRTPGGPAEWGLSPKGEKWAKRPWRNGK